MQQQQNSKQQPVWSSTDTFRWHATQPHPDTLMKQDSANINSEDVISHAKQGIGNCKPAAENSLADHYTENLNTFCCLFQSGLDIKSQMLEALCLQETSLMNDVA